MRPAIFSLGFRYVDWRNSILFFFISDVSHCRDDAVVEEDNPGYADMSVVEKSFAGEQLGSDMSCSPQSATNRVSILTGAAYSPNRFASGQTLWYNSI